MSGGIQKFIEAGLKETKFKSRKKEVLKMENIHKFINKILNNAVSKFNIALELKKFKKDYNKHIKKLSKTIKTKSEFEDWIIKYLISNKVFIKDKNVTIFELDREYGLKWEDENIIKNYFIEPNVYPFLDVILDKLQNYFSNIGLSITYHAKKIEYLTDKSIGNIYITATIEETK